MENHVLSYVKRPLITKWKRLVLTRDVPVFAYGSNDDHVFAKRLKNGGTLWIIASIPNRPAGISSPVGCRNGAQTR